MLAPRFNAYDGSFYSIYKDGLVIWTSVIMTDDGVGSLGYNGCLVDFANDIPLDEDE